MASFLLNFHLNFGLNPKLIPEAPFWTDKPPQDINEPEGSAAEIHCVTSGTPTPIVQWFINGVPLHGLIDVLVYLNSKDLAIHRHC